MNIGILGYGRMGKEIEKIAVERGHLVSEIFDIDRPFTNQTKISADVLIDFSLPDAVLDNLKSAAYFGVPVVEGTTGWLNRMEEAKRIQNLTMILSPNYSLGVYLFSKITQFAAHLIGNLGEYDCYLHEWHHAGKADSPSGTAKNLAEILLEALPDKESILTETSHAKIDPKALHVTSTRVGRVPGTHEIGFDSAADSVTLKHQAHGRRGFAYGAVRAAEWLAGKKGLFSMDDFMRSLVEKTV